MQESPDKRPDIEQVVEMLKTEGELPELEEEPEEPTLREEGERLNARLEPEEPTFKVKHRTQGAKTMTSNKTSNSSF